MKTKNCDECRNASPPHFERVCMVGHTPRFYMPRNHADNDYGYKSRCEDFNKKAEA